MPPYIESLEMTDINTGHIESLNRLATLDGKTAVEFGFPVNGNYKRFEMRAVHEIGKSDVDYTVFGLWDITDLEQPRPVARAVYLTINELNETWLSVSEKSVIDVVSTKPGAEQFDTLTELDRLADINDFKAFAVAPGYRNSDLGQLFFAATLHVLNESGTNAVEIRADTTELKPRAQFNTGVGADIATPFNSYYLKYANVLGLKVDSWNVPTVVGTQPKNEQVTISTKITPPQYHLLTEYLA